MSAGNTQRQAPTTPSTTRAKARPIPRPAPSAKRFTSAAGAALRIRSRSCSSSLSSQSQRTRTRTTSAKAGVAEGRELEQLLDACLTTQVKRSINLQKLRYSRNLQRAKQQIQADLAVDRRRCRDEADTLIMNEIYK